MQPTQQMGTPRRSLGALSLLTLGFVLVIVGAWYTDLHRPLPNALQPVTGMRWWLTPVERNAFMRMPVIDGDLHAIDVYDDGRVLWAVGEEGLIVGTRDGGRTWLRGTIVTDDAPADTPAEAPQAPQSRARAFNFDVIGSAHAAENPSVQSNESYANPTVEAAPSSPAQSSPVQSNQAPVRVPPKMPEQTKTPEQTKAPEATKTPEAAKAPPAQTKQPPARQEAAPVQQQTQIAVAQSPSSDLARATLRGVAIIDADRAVAVGAYGLILLTTDGGETWRPRLSGGSESFLGVSFSGQKGIAVGSYGAVAWTGDGGLQWQRTRLGAASLWAVARASEDRWIAVGDAMLDVPWSREATPIASTSTEPMLAIASREPHGMLAAGDRGTIVRLRAGQAAVAVPFAANDDDPEPDFIAVAFAPGGQWLVATTNGHVYATSNQGDTWTRVRAGSEGSEISALASASSGAFSTGTGGVIERSSADGTRWDPLAISRGVFTSLQMTDSSRGLITGANGLQLATSDGGRTWSVRSSEGSAAGVAAAPSRQAYFNERVGVKIDDAGALVRTEDRGEHWKAVALPANVPLLDVQFASTNRAVLLGLGRVYVSKDAGATFKPVTYRRYPSPWIWVASAVLLLSAAYSVRRRMRAPSTAQQPSSITDAAASDRPIGWSDPDPAGLRDIALGLSRFMRNRRTEPPLTIAITGEWGTGKSSLMNLLRHDLSRYGYRPVWFNAWHHQSGENLLGSLLANIHAQGVPPWHTLAGIDFRATLLLIRARRFWLRLAFTLFLLAVIFFSYRTLGAGAAKLWESLTSASSSGVSDLGAATGLLGLLVAFLTPVIGAVRAVSAFGLQPGKLIAAVTTTRADESAKQQAGARYRFAREFEDFTHALDPRPLVIFIDDLDRCRAENVIEVLEAVNFLVSSGRCIVVIGMARRWVETCVGLAFKDLALAQAEAPVGQDHPDELSEQQVFARNYLEKLINVEIRVPRLSDSAARALLQGEEPAADEGDAKRAVVRAAFWLAPQLLLATAACAIVTLGWFAAEWLKDLDAQAQRQEQASVTARTNPMARATPDMQPATSDRTAVSSARVVFENADAEAPWSWYLGTGSTLFLALAGLGVLALFARKEARTDDSPDFRDALAILQPWIALGGSSPRSLKRFVNHVRYIAMRFRAGAEFPSLVERQVERLNRALGLAKVNSAPSDAMPRVQLPEELLVAFATLHRCDERWLEQLFLTRSARLEELAEHLLVERFPEASDRASVLRRLQSCLIAFNERFPDSALGRSELLDRRYAVAFYDAMAIDAGVREQQLPDEPAPPAASLRPTAS